jgi:hypothetical protein
MLCCTAIHGCKGESITGGAGCAGEDMMHMRAIALKIGAALNRAMLVATQYLAPHLLPFRVGCGLVPHLERKLCVASAHAVKGPRHEAAPRGRPVANRMPPLRRFR